MPAARVGVAVDGSGGGGGGGGALLLSWADAHLALPVEQFAAVAKTLCGFPSFFAAPLFRRVRAQFCGGSGGGGAPLLAPGSPHAVAGPAGWGLAAAPDGGGGDYDAVLPWAPVASPAASDDPTDRDVAGTIPLAAFVAYWRAEMAPHDHASRFFRLVKRRAEPAGIRPPDFMPLLEELLAFHPGLAFLESTPEFQASGGGGARS